jgi:molybdopterin-containing oxidoreductase family membrane subunit
MISLTPLTNLNSAIPWGLWVSIYIWLIGISSGSIILVSLGNIKDIPSLKKITRLGITIALSTLLAGLLSILIDLGHIERFYKLFISPNPTSVMAWMVWLYGFYAAVLTVALIFFRKGIPRFFLHFVILFAVIVLVLESLLFALPPGRHWHSVIFPVHFLASSLVSGIAALIFAVGVLWPKKEKLDLLKGLSKIALLVIIVNLVVEIIDLISFGGMSHIQGWVLLLGNLIAITLLLRHNSFTITLAGGIELIDIFLSKYNSLLSGEIVEPFRNFAEAYIEPRLQFHYAPSFLEMSVSIFLIGLAAGLFYFLYKLFPLTREE